MCLCGGDVLKMRGCCGVVVSDLDDDDLEVKVVCVYWDEDFESDDEDETNEEYARVGARLLFLYLCVVFFCDVYVCVFVVECYGVFGGEVWKCVGELV